MQLLDFIYHVSLNISSVKIEIYIYISSLPLAGCYIRSIFESNRAG